MKRLRLIKNILFCLLMGAVGLYLAAYSLWPQTVEQYLPYRLYTVLTDSMAPYMPPMSLVLVRQIPADAPLELAPEQIVTFRADRFGQQIIQTHRFSHTEWDEELGQTIYRTHPEDTTDLDFYKTTRQDILGVYVFHLPWLGKVMLFLQSPWGLVLLGEQLVIFLVNQLIKARWVEREQQEQKREQPPQAGGSWRFRRGCAPAACSGRWRYTAPKARS